MPLHSRVIRWEWVTLNESEKGGLQGYGASQLRAQHQENHSPANPQRSLPVETLRKDKMLKGGLYRLDLTIALRRKEQIDVNSQWWSNGSGHYQPYVEDAEQANLPTDSFFLSADY